MSQVPSITTAPRSVADEHQTRLVRYFWTMVVRTACFGLAVATTGWVRWAFVVGAVVLPYVAVVLANAGRSRREPDSTAEFLPAPMITPGEPR